MDYTVEIHAKARLEIIEGWVWYEEQKDGLGDKFEEAVFAKIERIKRYPLHNQVKNGYRQVALDRFPYVVVYKLDEKQKIVRVTSIFHMSRNPNLK